MDGSRVDRFAKNIEAISPDGLSYIEQQGRRFYLGRMGSDDLVELHLPDDLTSQSLDRFFWSPDSQLLLLGKYENETYTYPYVWSIMNSEFFPISVDETIKGQPGHYWPPRAWWSPDGQRIAVCNGCQLLLIDLAQQSVRKAVLPCENYSNYPVWSSDSRQILVYGGPAPQLLDADALLVEQLPGLSMGGENPGGWLLPYGGGWVNP